MSLSSGSRIGPHEVVGILGRGGMGEVYRANDGRLKRDVALKVLPDDAAGDGDRRARLQREAQFLATLTHQSIAAMYGIEAHGASSALVMELVEGETLAERLARAAIPVSDALLLPRELADALEHAHEHGVPHRDRKPENI